MDQSTEWRFYWYRDTQTSYPVAQTDGNSYNISSVKVSDGGQYWCRARYLRDYTQYSNAVWVNVTVRPKAIATLLPNSTDIFSGNMFILRCDIQGIQYMDWQYSWYINGLVLPNPDDSGQNYTVYSADQFHSGDYTCRGLLSRDQQTSEISEAVRVTVAEIPMPVLRGPPQTWLTEGDSVTLSCEVRGSTTGWRFHWYKTAPYIPDLFHAIHRKRGYYLEMSEGIRGAGGSYTLSPVALRHTGVYVCGAERGEPAYHTEFSQPQPLWVTGLSPPSTLIVSPNRNQHFDYSSLSLSCEGSGNGWILRSFSDQTLREMCPTDWRSETRSSCSISSASPSDSGVYWCQSESGEQSNPVKITVHNGNVILEGPVHLVTEGDPLTLRCRYRYQPSNISADFYKDGTLLQTSTTGEMTIPAVSKSHEGLYKCRNPERGESPQSWILIKAGLVTDTSTHGQQLQNASQSPDRSQPAESSGAQSKYMTMGRVVDTTHTYANINLESVPQQSNDKHIYEVMAPQQKPREIKSD
ncbi:Fc receptor-like protein 5 [Alosa pseudoharengus]|uniref:Fc receptor-like protein 5 n=1 Tax=Alosa pseudoharengus TaxID=34774 RepID=UPI003F8890D2